MLNNSVKLFAIIKNLTIVGIRLNRENKLRIDLLKSICYRSTPKSGEQELQIAPMDVVASMAITASCEFGKIAAILSPA